MSVSLAQQVAPPSLTPHQSEQVDFVFEEAFAPNIGLINKREQDRFRNLTIALPGLGGVGGSHVQALARLGVGGFHLADLDHFEFRNFNRQLGANMNTLGRPKVDVLAETALSINPEARIKTFPKGIGPDNMDAFLDGVDVVVDGLDFFAIDVRRLLFSAAHKRGIPVITAAPLGYGAAILVFSPNGMGFDEYFSIDNSMTRSEQLAAFGLNLGPGLKNEIDPAFLQLRKGRGPALCSSCFLCAALAATEVLKLVTGRGMGRKKTHGFYFDAIQGRRRNIKRIPSLTKSLRGRLARWMAFRRLPELKSLHEEEVARGLK